MGEGNSNTEFIYKNNVPYSYYIIPRLRSCLFCMRCFPTKTQTRLLCISLWFLAVFEVNDELICCLVSFLLIQNHQDALGILPIIFIFRWESMFQRHTSQFDHFFWIISNQSFTSFPSTLESIKSYLIHPYTLGWTFHKSYVNLKVFLTRGIQNENDNFKSRPRLSSIYLIATPRMRSEII